MSTKDETQNQAQEPISELAPEQEDNQAQTKTKEQLERETQIQALYYQVREIIRENFPGYEIAGQIGQHPQFGTFFAYQLNEADGKGYATAFFLSELARQFQGQGLDHPTRWITSFFHEKVEAGENAPFPSPPETEEAAKQAIEETLVPLITRTLREEFPEQNVHVEMEMDEKHGPVLEAGFPSIKDGHNTCVLPLSYLYALYYMNRDPAEPMVVAMYRLLEERKAAAKK